MDHRTLRTIRKRESRHIGKTSFQRLHTTNYYPKITKQTIKTHIQNETIKKWKERWTNKGKQLHKYPVPWNTDTYNNNNFELREFIWGHEPRKSYLHKLKLANIHTCKCDCTTEQTYDHLLHDCTLLNGARTKLINHMLLQNGARPTEKKELLTHWINRFIESKKIILYSRY